MNISRNDIGYTIFSRVEESLRFFINDKLIKLFGEDWKINIPEGIWIKIIEKNEFTNKEDIDEPIILLEESDLPDLKEIICFKGNYEKFFDKILFSQKSFNENMCSLYSLRCKIAHVKQNFTAIDLDLLIKIGEDFLKVILPINCELKELIQCIKSESESFVIKIPENFMIYDDCKIMTYPNNLPINDFDPDGGFIGRKEDVNKIMEYLLGYIHRVITITGAGGVGKTALAHHICQKLLNVTDFPFDGIVWVSAKEEKLTITGIEPIQPGIRNHEDVLNNILNTFGWNDYIEKDIEEKKYCVDIILKAGEKGILLVIDNLETIKDESVKEFIKDFPPPSKVLITSRLGLGEVERRYNLQGMKKDDSIILLRTIAREKGASSLSKLSEEVLLGYVDKMFRYPLAIKWVVGQVALGKDINLVICDLTSSTGDVAKFCFEHIFDNLLDENSKYVLYSLALNDKPILRGVLVHISNLTTELLDESLKKLTIASLIIPNQSKSLDGGIETRYELIPLTRNFIQSKSSQNPDIYQAIRLKTNQVQNLIEGSEIAVKQYKYSLRAMGAESEEEKVAATLTYTGYQKYQAGNYDDALIDFKRASEIAPNFSSVYRNWATMECEAGYYEKADELMKKATNLNPKDSSLFFVWGNIEKRRGRYDKAFEYIKKASILSPNDAPILGALGEVEKRRGNYKKADIFLRNALKGTYSEDHVRHKIICNTTIADNLRRWAELLSRDRQHDEVLKKLNEAFEFISEAYTIDNNDVRTRKTYLNICSDLCFQNLNNNLNLSEEYFKKLITSKPHSFTEKKILVRCCYNYSQKLLKNDLYDEAKRIYLFGEKFLYNIDFAKKYKILGLEFKSEKYLGILLDVKDKGYGFIKLKDNRGQEVFAHINEFSPSITLEEFILLKGKELSFFISKSEKGLIAKEIKFPSHVL